MIDTKADTKTGTRAVPTLLTTVKLGLALTKTYHRSNLAEANVTRLLARFVKPIDALPPPKNLLYYTEDTSISLWDNRQQSKFVPDYEYPYPYLRLPMLGAGASSSRLSCIPSR